MTNPREIRLRSDVQLAPLEPAHAPNMYRWVCDPHISRNIGLTREPSLEKTQQWITAVLQDPHVQPFAILLAGRHVGNVVLDRIDHGIGSARLFVYIGEAEARSGGIGTTALYLALRQAFREMRLHKVWLTVHPYNFPAISVYTKLGFVLEGILRDDFLMDGRRIPSLYMGLLESEFEGLKAGTERRE
jgi:RimJ/RimL family protein N-acetyltransferase